MNMDSANQDPNSKFTYLDRRAFLLQSGSGIMALFLSGQVAAQNPPSVSSTPDSAIQVVWLKIGADHSFTFYLAETEMGQGVTTSLTTILAEELDVDPKRFRVETAPLSPEFGNQMTGNSSSVRQGYAGLRQVGARVRQAMLRAAARHWQLPVEHLVTSDAQVLGPHGKMIGYGDLVPLLQKDDLPAQATLKSKQEFRWIGGDVPNLDCRDKINGQAQYGMDFKLPGLLVARVIRPPAIHGQVDHFDAAEALKMPGVRHVVAIRSGVAIVAERYWQCLAAENKIKVTWKIGERSKLDSATITDRYRASLGRGQGSVVEQVGDVEALLPKQSQPHEMDIQARTAGTDADTSPNIIEAFFEAPFLSHATMEPQNFTAWVREDCCDLWGPTQGPSFDQAAVANFTGLAREKIIVHPSRYVGGGFGRRGDIDFKLEAVEVSMAVRAPVKVIWSREDDQTHSAFRPLSVHRLRGRLGADGYPVAWHHELAVQELQAEKMKQWISQGGASWLPTVVRDWMGSAAAQVTKWKGKFPISSEGAKDLPYGIPHRRLECLAQEPDVPITFWRSVGHSHNAFAVESFVDELAHAANADPYAYRRHLLQNHPRHLQVLDRAAAMANWAKPTPGTFLGIAQHHSFGSYVAMVVAIRKEQDRILLHRVFCAVDCGLAIQPRNVRAQVQGGVIFGLSAACFGEISFRDGKIRQDNFDTYRVIRMDEAPHVEVEVLESTEEPAGAGEIGVPPIAPALANAIFAATGKRLRRLPLAWDLM